MKKTSRRTGASQKRSPTSRDALELAFSAIARTLRSIRAPWYLFGAQAVVLHGVPRQTDDIDVTVLLPGGSAELLRRLRRERFETRIEDADFLATARVIPTVHRPSGWRVDFVLGGPGLEQHFLEEAVAVKIGKRAIKVIRAEHLVVLKALAGREKDLEDIRGIVRVMGDRLDLDETRRLIVMLQTELGDSQILPLLERILDDVRDKSRRR